MAYGILNAHSEHSLHQSISSIKDIIQKAKKIGATHVAVSDINTMTGCIQCIETCAVNDVKPIVACELAIHDGKCEYRIVLYALNYNGYQNICRLLTLANHKLLQQEQTIPFLYYEELESYVDRKNIIISTGGKEGMIEIILSHNKKLKHQISELEEEMKTLDSPNDIAYQKNKEIVEKNMQLINMLEQRKDILKKLSQKNYSRRKKGIEAYKGTEQYSIEVDKLAKEIEETELSKVELNEITKNISSLKKTTTIISKKIKQMENNHVEYKKLNDAKQQMEGFVYEDIQSLIIQIISKYKKFMTDNFYIQISADCTENLCMQLIQLANKTDTAYVITCNSYMTDKGNEDYVQYMRNMDNESWEEVEESLKRQYVMSEDELRAILGEFLSEIEIRKGLEANSNICNKINFSMLHDKHYPRYIQDDGSVCQNSSLLLAESIKNGIKKRNYQDKISLPTYRERLKYEYSVIVKMGFADYLLIVADFIKYAKNYVTEYEESHIGISVGPGRGSAAGCLICFFLEITNIDPLIYNLKFERFLNPDRVTMPDIDIDFSEEIRPVAIQYVTNKYGKESVSQIRTSMTQQANASTRNAARMVGVSCGDKLKYADLADEICKLIPAKTSISDCEKMIIETYKDSKQYDAVKEIIRYAKKTEGLMISLGVHPAGVIIGDAKPLQNYIPLLYNQSIESWVVQCDKDEAERIGLLKMDFLIVKILDKLTETVRRIWKYEGAKIDLNEIPYEKKVFEEIYCAGNTEAVFQCESDGMKKVLKDFKPESIEELILIISVYRPGPMDSVPDIIAVKHGKKEPNYCIPELSEILNPTYGYPVYQEQIMDIFHKCAGFTSGEADIIRRYMSKKKTDKFISYKDKFLEGIMNHGASREAAEKLWDSLVTFSEYAFNKSHACAYAVVSYMTAYCKYYFGSYYYCSVLNNVPLEKYKSLIYNAKNMGIDILLPSVNDSSLTFENKGGNIIFGLNKIKGFNSGYAEKIIHERQENGRFSSFKDFVMRVAISENAINALIDAGATDIFQECNRKQKKKSLPVILGYKKNIDAAKKNDGEKSDKRIEEIIKELDNYMYDDLQEDSGSLEVEKEKLGAYISAHPLDRYADVYKTTAITHISNISSGDCTIVGIIKNLVIRNRKKDGKPMAFFNIEDISGTIPVCTYVQEYQKYKGFICEGNVISISGSVDMEIKEKEGEIQETKKLIVSKIDICRITKEPMLVSIQSKADEAYAYYSLEPYKEDGGHDILLHYQDTGLIEKKKMAVSNKALTLNEERLFLCVLQKK